MSTYRAAIIGLSGIGARPAPAAPHPVLGTAMPHSHAAAYAAHDEVELVAYCDISDEALGRFARDWNGTWPEARAYSDYRQLLAGEELDILSVVTPDHLHAGIVVDACAAGIPAIFCEKPLATSLADADRMLAAASRSGTVISVDHTRRWYPEYWQARRLIDDGEIGKVYAINAVLGGARAMLFRNGTHLIDCMNFFAGSDPVQVTGRLQQGFRDYGPEYAGDGGRDPATDPGAAFTVEYAGGVIAHYTGLQGSMRRFELDILGSEGRIRIGSDVAEVWKAPAGNSLLTTRPTVHAHLEAAVRELVDVLAGRLKANGLVSDAGEARKTVAVIQAVLASNQRGGVPVAVN